MTETKKKPQVGDDLPSKEYLLELAKRVEALENLRDFSIYPENLRDFGIYPEDSKRDVGTAISAEDRSLSRAGSYSSSTKVARFVTPGYAEPVMAAMQTAPNLVRWLLTVYTAYEQLAHEHRALRGLVQGAVRAADLETPEFEPLELRRT